MSPRLKLALPAIATGLVAFLTLLTASTDWSLTVLGTAAAAGAAATLQYLAPELSPKIGLVGTALMTGVASGLALLSDQVGWDHTAIRSALAAFATGLLQALTPISTVGITWPVATRGEISRPLLGRKAPRLDIRTLRLATYLRALPPIPAEYTVAKLSSWGMYLNNRLGDCTVAAAAHMIKAWTEASGEPSSPSTAAAETFYWLTGNPSSTHGVAGGRTDDGRVELDILKYWRKHGLDGHHIQAFAAVEPDPDAMRAACFLCGGLYLGLALPKTAQGQTIWDVVGDGKTGDSAPGSWGGHAVNVIGYDKDGVTVITWGQTLKVTWAFLATYCDERWAIVSPDWEAHGGKTVTGVDWDALIADLHAVTA